MISDQLTGIPLITGYKPPKTIKRLGGVCSAPDLLFGVELEIEGLRHDPESYCIGGVVYHPDGSLRNNGAEFVTQPMTYENTEAVLTRFFELGKFNENNYSERCSVHVHMNVGDITEEHLRTFLAVYASHERALFEWIGDNRKHNIFCVPWYETNMGVGLAESFASIKQKTKNWMKYTALNLLPIWRQNTIEFRHMAGTHNLKRILTWVRMIACMYTYSKNTKFQEFVNTVNGVSVTSHYAPFTYSIFAQEGEELVNLPSYVEVMEQSLLESKMVLNAPKPVQLQQKLSKLDSNIEDLMRQFLVERPERPAAAGGGRFAAPQRYIVPPPLHAQEFGVVGAGLPDIVDEAQARGAAQ